jgi:hypothetical protein
MQAAIRDFEWPLFYGQPRRRVLRLSTLEEPKATASTLSHIEVDDRQQTALRPWY